MSNRDASFRLMQVMLSTQDGGAETFFEKMTLALADAGVRQLAVIEPNEGRRALLEAHPNVEVRTIRFGGLRKPLGMIAIRAAIREWKPDAALAWMSRAMRLVPTGSVPVAARLGNYYKVDPYRKADRLIGITPDIVSYLTRSGIPEERCLHIPNFGEIAELDEKPEAARARLHAEMRIPEGHTVLLTLGRLHPVKAHDILLHALAQVPRATALLAGEGPERQALIDLAESLGIADRVRFLGWRRDVAALFAASDISVFPSREEAHGTVVQESWGQRTPLVTAAAKGPAYLVTPEENALLVPTDDADALATAIERVRSDPDLADRLRRNGYETFRRLYSRDTVVAQYVEMFNEMIEAKRR